MIDLKQLMQERSAQPPPQAGLRYQQIRRRLTTRKRRRIAMLAAAVAVIVAIAGGYAGLPHSRVSPGPAPSPAKSPDSPGGFPPYAFGRKLVKYATAPMSSRTVTLTWTPTRLDFHLSELCSGIPESVSLRGTMTVNGADAGDHLCAGRNGYQPARTDEWIRDGWIRAGEPITLTLTVENAYAVGQGESPAPMPDGGAIALAIYVPVPFEEYQLPPRPAQLKPLADWTPCPLDHLAVGDPGLPLKPVTVTMEWSGVLIFRWDTQTPGSLHVAVDGVRIATLGWWDYGGLNWSRLWDTTNPYEWAGVPGWKFPTQGAQVTITYTPEHFTGGWQAGLKHMLNESEYGPCPR